jgi:hypothetical protein
MTSASLKRDESEIALFAILNPLFSILVCRESGLAILNPQFSILAFAAAHSSRCNDGNP